MNSSTSGRSAATAHLLSVCPVIPVITIECSTDAVPLAHALIAGGIRAIEITLRTPAGREAARAIVKGAPEAIVGVGTVLNSGDVDIAKDLGAHFIVSPGATPELLASAAASGLPFLPGVQTATELMTCLAAGLDIVKFFPAVPAGGLAMIRAFAGPFPQVRFCPTGGIGESNAAEWLAEPNVLAVGGSWVAPTADIRNGDWAAITARAERAQTLRRR